MTDGGGRGKTGQPTYGKHARHRPEHEDRIDDDDDGFSFTQGMLLVSIRWMRSFVASP